MVVWIFALDMGIFFFFFVRHGNFLLDMEKFLLVLDKGFLA